MSTDRPRTSPPPLPPADNQATPGWHVSAGGKTVGPVTVEQICQNITAGKVPLSAVVWREGMAEWLPLSQVPEFANITAPPTPPAPPLVRSHQTEGAPPSLDPAPVPANETSIEQDSAPAPSSSSTELTTGQLRATVVAVAFAASLILSILDRIFYGSWMTMYSLLTSTIILSGPFLLASPGPKAPDDLPTEWKLGGPIGAAIGLLYGFYFGGVLSSVFYGAFVGTSAIAVAQLLQRSPSAKAAPAWVVAAFIVLHLFGFLSTTTSEYQEGFDNGHKFASEMYQVEHAQGSDTSLRANEELLDIEDFTARTGTRLPYPEGTSKRRQWVRGYKDGIKSVFK